MSQPDAVPRCHRSAVSYINQNGPAFSFFASLLLALITAAYVVFTRQLLGSSREANRLAAEPALLPRVEMTDLGLCVIVRNASSAVAAGVRLYTGCGSIALVREPVSDASLLPGEETRYYLDREDDEGSGPEFMKVLWGGAELLYADAYDRVLIRTRIFVEEYRNPPGPSDWLMRVGVSRERHERKSLLKAARKQPETRLDDPRDTWPLWRLWVAAEDPFQG